jgi:predicted  nucleic acid-binding Zn-ribbon protein
MIHFPLGCANKASRVWILSFRFVLALTFILSGLGVQKALFADTPTVEPVSPVGEPKDQILPELDSNLDDDQKLSQLSRQRSQILRNISIQETFIRQLEAILESSSTASIKLRKEIEDLEEELIPLPTRKENVEREKARIESQIPVVDKAIQAERAADRDNTGNLTEEQLANFVKELEWYVRRRLELEQEFADIGRSEQQLNESLAKEKDELQSIDGYLVDQQEKLRSARETLSRLVNNQASVEEMISEILNPKMEENKFRLWATGAFTILVGVLILGFFYILRGNDKIKEAIFSGDSGIQFLTLFSLVIAIILFGITRVLEGKELAALLGGLSGYILGRVAK